MSNVSSLNNIFSKYANINDSNSGLFTSINNSYANASRYSGGRRKKKKSKKIINLYKKKRTKRRRRKLRGGGLTSVTNCNNGYSTGGVNIPSNLSALANPVMAIPNGPAN